MKYYYISNQKRNERESCPSLYLFINALPLAGILCPIAANANRKLGSMFIEPLGGSMLDIRNMTGDRYKGFYNIL